MQTVREFFDAVGRDIIQEELGHGVQVLSRAAVTNKIPSEWYFGLERLCAIRGVDMAPRHLFRGGDAIPKSQEREAVDAPPPERGAA